jgi:hypothetical protein
MTKLTSDKIKSFAERADVNVDAVWNFLGTVQYCETYFNALNILHHFAGEDTLNHASRAERISNKYEEITESFYLQIHNHLLYSVFREFRHFSEETCITHQNFEQWGATAKISKQVRSLYYNNKLDYALDAAISSKTEMQNPSNIALWILFKAFSSFKWAKWYGGKNWATAVKFLIEKPKTIKQKQIWIDRVLDLQHNSGHILNKTHFSVLSAPKRCHRVNQSKRNKRTALNYRRYAERISDLTRYSSSYVSRLVSANMNYIPQLIR